MNTIKKAIIFDRDGVLNKDKGYIHSWDELEWIDGAREAVARLTEDGWLLFVATNQSGVARGYYTESDVQLLHEQMNSSFRELGGNVTKFFFVPIKQESLNTRRFCGFNIPIGITEKENLILGKIILVYCPDNHPWSGFSAITDNIVLLHRCTW